MFARDAFQYLDERILTLRITLLWTLLTLAMFLTGTASIIHPFWILTVSGLYLFIFRLWDDVADLKYDRVHHPERHLVQSSKTPSYRSLLVLFIIVFGVLVWATQGPVYVLMFLGFVCALGLLYTLRAIGVFGRPLTTAFVLTKYSLLIFLFAPEPRQPIVFIASIVLYLVPLVDEIFSTGYSVVYPAAAILGLSILAWFALYL